MEPRPRFTGQFVIIRCLSAGSVIHSVRYDYSIALITLPAPLFSLVHLVLTPGHERRRALLQISVLLASGTNKQAKNDTKQFQLI